MTSQSPNPKGARLESARSAPNPGTTSMNGLAFRNRISKLYVLFKIDESCGSMATALNAVPSRLDQNGKEQKRKVFNMAKRFREHGKQYFELLTPRIEVGIDLPPWDNN